MLSFKNYLTESVRQGLPHITSMDHDQFQKLVSGGKIHLHRMTEKTDGMTHVMGYDDQGFYTQSSGSGSEKMRTPTDFHARAQRRAQETGKPYDPTPAHAFGHIHDILHKNTALQDHLKSHYERTGKETKIRGEVFYRPLSSPSEHHGEVKFVGTSYSTSHMGTVGKYVVHSRLPENKHVKNHKQFSTPEINFDNDVIDHKKTSVNVGHEARGLRGLNTDLLSSRTTPKNKAAKQQELAKLDTIKKAVSKKVDDHIRGMSLKPKWGTGSEGLVVHPSSTNPSAPRFKVTSDAFRKFKEDTKGQDFKKR